MNKDKKETIKELLQKNKIVLGALAVAVVASGAATMATFADSQQSTGAAPSKDGHRWEMGITHGNMSDVDHVAMKQKFEAAHQAVADNNFEAWKEALSDHPKADEYFTQEKFDILVQAYNLRQSGDTEGAKQLLKDSGMQPQGKRAFGKFKGGEKMGEMRKEHEAMKEIMDNGDYDAWAALMAQHEHFDAVNITLENFAKLQQAHQLHQEGKHEEAKQLMEEVFGSDFGGVRPHMEFRKRPGRG